MKRLLFISFVFLFSCNNSNEIKEIETSTFFFPDKTIIYSTTDKKGFTQTLLKTEITDYVKHFESKISEDLIDSIVSICENKKNKDFIFKSIKEFSYAGNWHSVRITYENGKEIFFMYPYANDENKQLIPFQSLSRKIEKDSINAKRKSIAQLPQLITKRLNLSNFTESRIGR